MQPAEQNTTMKENQNATLSDTKYIGREADPVIFPLNSPIRDTSPLVFEVKGGAECLNIEYVEDSSLDSENGNRDSPRKEHRNGLSYCNMENDADSLCFETDDKDKRQDHEHSIKVEDLTHCSKNESKDSSLPFISASELFEMETDKHTANSVLTVCYKEINCQGVKDICVDEGVPLKSKNLVDSCKDDNYNHCKAIKGGIDIFKESHENIIAREKPRPLPESFSDKDSTKHCDSDYSVQQTSETNSGDANNTVTNYLKDDSFVDKTLPVQEFGTRSFLRSFLSSLDSEDEKVAQQSDQIVSGEAVLRDLASLSTEAETKIVGNARNLVYNSKVESGSITFNFNPPSAAVSGIIAETTEDVKEQPGDVHDRKGANLGNLLNAEKVNTDNSSDTSLDINHDNSNISSATTQVQCISCNATSDKNIVKQHYNANSPSSSNNDGQVVEPSVSEHEHRKFGNVFDVEHFQYDEGESSFSVAGLIDDSGPIPNSGSLSHCSDGSTTSGRSFAFPILQSECNISSPTRMKKADVRHFRKRRGWRSGLVCCRF